MRKGIESAVFSVPLDKIQIKDYKEDDMCWKLLDLTNPKHMVILCGMTSDKTPIE
jgi:hypothetical protein